MFYFFDQVDSTNRLARELADKEKTVSGTVLQAKTQTAGRGQYGRSFASPQGGLYFSLLLKPDLPAESLPLITLAAGLAVRMTLFAEFALAARIKWPNDIYLGRRKVAGILCETLPSDHGLAQPAIVIIGVGLNVNSRVSDFPAELAPLVTTVLEHLQRQVNLDALRDRLVAEITVQVAALETNPEGVLAAWRQFDYLVNQPVRHGGDREVLRGTGLGINDRGCYLLRDDQGQEHEIVGGQLRPDFS